MDNLHRNEEKGEKEKCTIPSKCISIYADHIVSGNNILQNPETERNNLATQTKNAKKDNAITLQDQTIDDNDADDDDSDVILVPIEKGCENKRLREDVTPSLQNKVQNINLSSITSNKAIAAGSSEQTQSHKTIPINSNSTNIINQNIFDNNQKTETNQYNITDTSTIASDSTENNTQKLYKFKDSGQNSEVVVACSDKIPSKDETSTTSNVEAKLQQHTISQGGNVMSDHIDLEQTSGKKCDIATESGNQSFKSLVSASVSNDSSSVDSLTDAAADVTTTTLSNSLQGPSVASKLQSLESRPIYPNVPYSPYASPYGSPRSNRRRPPLRESRRISIEQSGSFLQLNQYKLMDQIGQGSYGLVKLAYSEEDSTHYAMKILSKRRLLRQAGLMRRGPKKTTSPLDRVYREIAVLKKLDHPNVVKLVEVLDDPMEDSLYMVFELVKQGEVLNIPTETPLTEERAWSVFRETLLGLEYLHYQRIIHGDLKPDNLLLTECGQVKIADLGVCNEFLGEDATMSNGSTAGTPAFRGPESLNLGQNLYCGKAADIWALGATLYSLVFGNVPFLANSIPILYEKIKKEPLSFPDNPKISHELRDCIQRMLTKDPVERINLPQLKEHAWVTTGGQYPLLTEEENCRLVQVSDDDINSVVRSIPKLDTLILIKTMLKKHSFGNPFAKGVSGRAPQRGGSRLERFVRAGRSNSAPGAYNMAIDRQHSADNVLLLPSLSELGSSSNNEET